MSSIADEIEKLYGMYEKDILTKEEFQEAKAAALAKHKVGATASAPTPAPAPAVAPAPPVQTPPPATQPPATAGGAGAAQSDFQQRAMQLLAQHGGQDHGISALGGADFPLDGSGARPTPGSHSTTAGSSGPNVSAFEDGGSCNGLHLTAYGHLKTILNNLINHPTDPKFRKLRVQNARLAKELFQSPAVRPLLFSLGFLCVDTDQAVQVAQAEAQANGATSVIHGEGEVFFLPLEVPIQAGVLAQLIQRLDAFKARDEQEIAAQAQYDNQRKSLGMTVRRSLWVEAMTRKEIDLHIASEMMRNPLDEVADMLAVFRRILTRIAADPENKGLRTLKSSDPAIRSFIAAFGSLEFLCARVGFLYGDNGLELPSDRDAAFLKDKVLSAPAGYLVKLEDVVNYRVAAQKELEAKIAHEEAAKQKRSIQQEEERMSNLARVKRGEAPEQRPGSAGGGSGKRIPIAEALQYLMGGQAIQDEKTGHLKSGAYTTDNTGFDIRHVTHDRQQQRGKGNREDSKVEEIPDEAETAGGNQKKAE